MPRPRKTASAHPLGPWCLTQFTDDNKVHDRVSLARSMGAPTSPPAGLRSYMKVAEDILKVLHGQGALVLTTEGWYRLATATSR